MRRQDVLTHIHRVHGGVVTPAAKTMRAAPPRAVPNLGASKVHAMHLFQMVADLVGTQTVHIGHGAGNMAFDQWSGSAFVVLLLPKVQICPILAGLVHSQRDCAFSPVLRPADGTGAAVSLRYLIQHTLALVVKGLLLLLAVFRT